MNKKKFLKEQWNILFYAVTATVISLYLIFNIIRFGMDVFADRANTSIGSNNRHGQPDVDGGVAYGLLLCPVFAAVCWWSFLSDWKGAKKQAALVKEEIDPALDKENTDLDSEANQS